MLYFFHEILFPSASAAVCIGLIQQAIFLSRPPVFKRQFFFAIGWRIVVTALLILCLFVDILVVRDFAVLPEGGNRLAVYYGLFFPELLQYACLLVVFGEYRHRLLLMAKGTPLRLGKFATLWVAATLLVLLLLPNHQLVHFLVYIAMGGIEAHQPLLYQRLGTYPDHHAEGFWFFYLSFAAVVCLAIGTAIWFWLLCHGRKNSLTQRLAAGLVVALLGCSSWYAVWYYTQGLAAISPEFVEAGLQGNWFDWLGIGMVLALLVTAAAAWIAGRESEAIPQQKSPPLAYHESWLALLALAAIVVPLGTGLLEVFFPSQPVFGTTSLAQKIIIVLTFTDIYIPLAISLLSLQVLWLRWKSRSDLPPLTVPVIDWRKFGMAWPSLALMLVIGVPVISAFCFSFWLGPWYLL